MRTVVESLRLRGWPRATALALMTIALAACSAESTRFNENPYASKPNEITGSIPAAQPASPGYVESRALPPAGAQPGPSRGATGVAGGSKGMASYSPYGPGPSSGATPSPAPAYNPSPAPVASRPAGSPDVTGTVASVPAAKPAATGHWSWEGGTPVTIARGESIDTVARRYGVPASAIAQANNLSTPVTLRAGQQLVIPRYHSAAASPATTGSLGTRAAAAAPARPAPSTGSSLAGNPAVHIVAPGETLSKISRLYGKSLSDLARANNIAPNAKLNVGDKVVVPGVRTSKSSQPAGPAVAQAKPAPETAKEPETPTVTLAAPVTDGTAADSTKSANPAGALPTFRWPARGRIISGQGPTPNGTQNDGINIALPEGTPVKAAEDGVVAYAGSELKGYGNLVLVRHPNGYVTAYAHAKELMVKRGEQVKRGQVIARSGQTGNVNAPQLHFEIRKGATPLDPTKFLNGG